MMKSMSIRILIVLVLGLFAISAEAAEPVSFGRDILPVLSANCFACHGPDDRERQADLRLDLEGEAKKVRDGHAAIVPGQSEKSLILARLTSTDPEKVMPPPASRKKVTSEQIDAIRRWVADGATWERHWSFGPIEKPAGSIDDLVQAELKKKKLAIRDSAAPHLLARRLSLDLIGLSPTPEIADAFANDPSPAAYEMLVDQLLQKPQFGEHWARVWLDLARYADTKGYEKDLGRTMWPYRDWVVNALNSDMPLDQFTVEQLAGDLLPNPTQQQLIATAFHRNTMSNDEGGTDDEEFRVAAIKDRIDTTIQVWMGLTMGCAKCHTHKYDPISNDDYYRFYAIFNQTEDADRYDDSPRLEVPTDDQKARRESLQKQLSQARSDLKAAEQAALAPDSPDERPWTSATIVEAKSKASATLTMMTDHSIVVSGPSEAEDTYFVTLKLPAGRYTAIRMEALPSKLADGNLGLGRNPADTNFVVSEFTIEQIENDVVSAVPLANPRANFSQMDWPVTAAIDGNPKTGWAVSPRVRERHLAIFDFAEPMVFDAEKTIRVSIVQNYGNRLTLGSFRLSTAGADPKTLPVPTPSPEVLKLQEYQAAISKSISDLNAEIAMVPIMRQLPMDKQRVTRIQKRGNFLDPGDTVQPAFLSAFGKPQDAETPSRLAVAKWLLSNENPLTPRVWANRIWARLFGLGIVETEEDFGALGALPSNPKLLELLAAEYRDQRWSLKKLLKTIVMSRTYRQSSDTTQDLRDIDPRNQMLSRGSRYRLNAEVVRDQALAISGLLSQKMGGPAVMPPQPAGLWRSTYNGKNWVDAEGEDRLRRSLYTYLKRTTPYPSFMTFDAGSGEVCQIRRIRTNTPLQALVTLNDPVYLEAAAALARRMVLDANTTESRVERGMRLALVRPIRPGESKPLVRLFRDLQASFETSPEKAAVLIHSARGERGEMPPDEFAAWIVTANAILNLDEFLTRN